MLQPALISITMLIAIPVHAQMGPHETECVRSAPYTSQGRMARAYWEEVHHQKLVYGPHFCEAERQLDRREAAQLTIHPDLDPRSYLFQRSQ